MCTYNIQLEHVYINFVHFLSQTITTRTSYISHFIQHGTSVAGPIRFVASF